MAKLAMTMAILAMEAKVSRVELKVSEMLREIGGDGSWKIRLDRILEFLVLVDKVRWEDGDTVRNRIRHLLKSEQTPTPRQTMDIIKAHALHCATELKAARAREEKLKNSIARYFVLAAEADAAFLGPSIDDYGRALDRLRQLDAGQDADPSGAASP